MSAPRFSVVIPTFNRAGLVPTAIRSALAQTDADLEVVVVDDGSTDDTAAVVAAIDDPRVRYQAQTNAGVSAARNAGAAAARGAVIVFLDSDDELLPHALERFRAAADENGWDATLSGWVQVSADRREWRTALIRRTDVLDGVQGPFLPGAFAISTSVFLAAGGYDDDLRFGENTALGWRLREVLGTDRGRIGALDEPLVVRYSRPDRGYDRARYDSAKRVLDHHRDALESAVGGTAEPRRRRATYLAIAGVSAARLGRRREAFALTLAAIRTDPRSRSRYANLLSVVRESVRRHRPVEASTRSVASSATEDSSAAISTPTGAIHAIVVTFGRPESLARIVDQLATGALDSLTVVDNAPSPESKEAAYSAGPRLPVTYVPMDENSGPAGGFAAGMQRVVATAADDDWMLLLDDDRLTGTIETVRRLREFATWLIDRGAPVGAVGQTGARFDRRSGRLVRPTNRELAGPLTVDYIANGQLLMIRVGVARAAGVFDPALFFGFEELDFCLRLGRDGYGVYVYGPAGLEARRRFGRLEPEAGQAQRRTAAWRRYYGVRNHIVIMRRYTSWYRAAIVTAGHLFWRPVSDLLKRRPGWRALTVAGTRGCIDAWTGRLGRRFDPAPEPAAQMVDGRP